MKAFILGMCITLLSLMSCKKEAIIPYKQNNSKPTVVKSLQELPIHPFYVRYKIYRKDLNSSFMTHLKNKNSRGC